MVKAIVELTVSIVATVTAVVGIVLYGGWAALWAYPTMKILNVLLEGFKHLCWKLVDIPLIRASKAGQPWRAGFWVVLPWMLDWFLSVTVIASLGYWMIRTLVPDLPACLAVVGVVAVIFSPVTTIVFLKGRAIGGEYAGCLVRGFSLGLFLLLFVLAVFMDVSPLMFFGLTLATMVLEVVGHGFRSFASERKTYRERRDGLRDDVPCDYGALGKWFPRPGVIFEMAPRPGKLPGYTAELGSSYTFYRIQPVNFCLSALLFCGGFLGLVQLQHPKLLLVLFLFALLWLIVPTGDAKRNAECSYLDRCAAFSLSVNPAIFIVGALALRYPDWPTRLATVACFTGAALPPTAFTVRGTSRNEPDAFRLVIVLLGVAAVFFAFGEWRTIFGDALAPWLCAICGTFVGNLYAVIRARFYPRAAVLSTDAATASAETKVDRRRRKRERQLAAFRRSQRRG